MPLCTGLEILMNNDERRQHQRKPANYPVEVSLLDIDNSKKTEQLHNISDGGISFISDNGERYQIGQQLVISIKSKTMNSTLSTAKAKVIWLDHPAYDLNTATIGVHFDELIESGNASD